MTDPKKKPRPEETDSEAERAPAPPPQPRPGELGHGDDPTRTEVHEAAFFTFSGRLTDEQLPPPAIDPDATHSDVRGEPFAPPEPESTESEVQEGGGGREVEAAPPAEPAAAPAAPSAPETPVAPETQTVPPTRTEAEAAPETRSAAPTRTEWRPEAGAPTEGAAPTKTESRPAAGEAPPTRTIPEFPEPAPPTAAEPAVDADAETATDVVPGTATPQTPVRFDAPNEVRVETPVPSRRAAPVPRSRRTRRAPRAQAPRRSLLRGALAKLGRLFRRRTEPWRERDWQEFAHEIATDGATTTTSRPEELQTDSSFLKGLSALPRPNEAAAEPAGNPAPSPAEAAASSSSGDPGARNRRAALRTRLARAARGIAATLRPPPPSLEPLGKLHHTSAWWRRTVTEIAMLFAIVVPIELAVTGGRVGAFAVHPHPYWIIVLPMAAARGVVAGLLAAALGTLLYTVGAVQALRSNEIAAIFTLANMTEPILFFAAGFLVGEFHDEIETRYKHSQRRLEETEERAERYRKERDVLAEANKILERRIVDHSAQFGNLIAAARRIEEAGRTEVFEVALDLVEEHCGASASVLLVLENQRFDLLCQRGWPEEEVPRRLQESRTSAFVARAIAEGTTVNGFAEGETPPEKGPLVVAPLFDATGVVKALLCLDDIPASRLNESTVSIFQGIAEWISASLVRMARGEEPPDPRASFQTGPSAEAWLGSVEELGDRLRLEIERCSRYGVPASFLAIQMTDWNDATRDGLVLLDRYVLMHFTDGLRPSDGLYRFGYPGCYLLVLAGTSLDGAEVVRTRLLRRVEYSPLQGVGAVEIFATGPDAEAPDLVSLAARVADRFRRRSPLPLEGQCPVKVPETGGVGNIEVFLRRVRMEISLAVRNGFDLHVIGITAEVQDAAAAHVLARHVRDAGAQILRQTDGVFAIGPHQAAVILPCTSAEHAADIGHRLVRAVRERDPNSPYGDVRIKVLGLGPSHPDPGSFLDALAKGMSREAQEPVAPPPEPVAAAAPEAADATRTVEPTRELPPLEDPEATRTIEPTRELPAPERGEATRTLPEVPAPLPEASSEPPAPDPDATRSMDAPPRDGGEGPS